MALKKGTKTAMEVGAGVLAAAAVAGAGYWFYGDKNAKKHRKAANVWVKNMKKDVVKNAKKLKRLDQKAMARIVDEASALYEGARSVDRKDLRQAANELKRNWEVVKAEVRGRVGGAKRVAKRSAKKAVKKTVKKAAPKRARKAAKRSR
ncbi:MAG: hypothetical protein QOE22_68 [Candidatus Parcubacteria bacterium]|jgi:hypothetical protein|nr:hypothetical protein [Candidatus Parcubacteria bacterium]